MKESKNHLNIDLEFLDKKEPPVATPKPDSHTRQTSGASTSKSDGHRYNWKNILIIAGIVLFISWVIVYSDNGSSGSSTNTPASPSQASNYDTDDDSVMEGEYSCSRYYYNQVVAIRPTETEQQIENAQTSLKNKSDEIDRLKNKIDNSYVNEYSEQWEIDQYNKMVNEYNSGLSAYNQSLTNLDARIDKYNAQIQKHNNYLIANCTKKY